jgi:hypothetical protein
MRTRFPMLKALAARGLLAIAFLFAQQTAALHWLSHAVEATQAKAGGPAGSPHCDACVAVAAFGGAAAARTTSHFPTLLSTHTRVGRTGAAARPAAPQLAFRSRAPPILV